MEQIRSFIAIDLTDDLRSRLARLEASLQAGGRFRAKWVKPESIHLTLKFLGDVAADKITAIGDALTEAAQGIPPFNLEVGELGAFPNLSRTQVVWVGISGEMDKLELLRERIETNLELLGFAPEKRAFRPHLTVARLYSGASQEERREFGRHIAQTRFESAFLLVTAVRLMKSQLTPAGAVYTRRDSAELTG